MTADEYNANYLVRCIHADEYDTDGMDLDGEKFRVW